MFLEIVTCIHDKYRHSRSDGSGTFDRIMKTVQMFNEFGGEFNILTVVHREVAEHIEEIYNEYKNLGLKWQQYINCLDPIGEKRSILFYPKLMDSF